jgi:transcriptional regulator with XRE-family HTH domain
MLRIRALREERHMNREALAYLSGLSSTTIANLEQGENARLSSLTAIARALEVPVSALLDEDEVSA